MKRTPMNRGSGFARPAYTAPPPAPVRPLGRVPNYTRVEYSGGGLPKEPRLECPHLLLMARRSGQSCLLQVPGVCEGARDDTCAAHGNGAIFNKGLGMKAHDFYVCRSCPRCHSALDTSMRASYEQRLEWFLTGHRRQIAEWRLIEREKIGSVADIAAAQWALDNLKRVGFI